MKLQFRNKAGYLLFELIDICAYQQYNNIKYDSCFKLVQKTFGETTYTCLECVNNVTYIFMRYLKVDMKPGFYIKIIV